MIRPRAGVLVFSESHLREDVYRKRKPIADRETARFIEALEPDVDLVWPDARELRGKREAIAAARQLEAANVDAVVLYVPIFIAPATVAHVAANVSVPAALACNEAPDSLSQLAFLAVGGAIDQIGLPCRRIAGDAAEEPNRSSLVRFLRAAAVRQRLRGETYGCFGGRALGISTGTADLALWERTFGVDIDHVDQFEIVRRGEQVPDDEVQRHCDWLRQRAGLCEFNETSFTPAHLEKQVRAYLATRRIAHECEFDFIGVKCQPEMSNGYCLQCVNVSLCNDPYDADGPKPPLPCSCEADADGALTMRILNLLSGGKPTSLNDIAWLTDREMTLANCGSMATYFTRLSERHSQRAAADHSQRAAADHSQRAAADPDENLAGLSLVPHSFGTAGGAATRFTVPAGVGMTFARLFRRGDRYALGVLTGETVEKDRAAQGPTIQTRPLIFVQMNVDKPRLLEQFGSNHILAVEGKMKPELEALAGLLDIDYLDFDRAE